MRLDEIRFWLLLWLLVSSSTVSGLVAIWTSLSGRHWFARAAVLLGIAWLLALVPAYDLVIVFTTEAICIAVPLLAWRWWRSRGQHDTSAGNEGRLRFRLLDILLITAVCAAIAAIAGRPPVELRDTWTVYVMWGAACGCTVTAACCALGGGRAPILSAITPLVAAFLPSQPADPLAVMMLSNPPCLYDWGWPEWAWYPALALVAAVTVTWLFLFRATKGRFHRERPSSPALTAGAPRWHVLFRQYALLGLSAAIVAPPVFAFWDMVTPTPMPVVLLPIPNGHDELTRIGGVLAASVPQDVDTATEGVLRKFVEGHRSELNDVRTALAHESVVPLKYTRDDIADITVSRNIYRGLWARARQAEFEGRCDEACDDYLMMLHLSEKTIRGGLIIDWLIGARVLDCGLDGIARLRACLSSLQLRKALAVAVALLPQFEPAQNAVARDQVWMEHAYGWPNRIRFVREPPNSLYGSLDTYYRAKLRLIPCELAARLYQRDHGRWPQSLDDLVPDYLEVLPEDPYTRRPFIYRSVKGDIILYSTGPDKTDNGGLSVTQTRPPPDGEDITLEPPISQGPCAYPR